MSESSAICSIRTLRCPETNARSAASRMRSQFCARRLTIRGLRRGGALADSVTSRMLPGRGPPGP